MKIALMSDSHDNVPAMEEAIRRARDLGAEAVLFAGDLVAPFTAKRLKAFEGPVYAVFGNNDGERQGLSAMLDIVDGPRTVELGARRIVIVHDIQDLGAVGDGADLVVCGHTHDAGVEPGPPMVVNPGEIGGWLTGRKTFCIADLSTLKIETIELDGTDRQ